VILRPLGDVVVWMPPLSVTDPEIELLASATAAAIEEACST
jgi:adenosylmethionine-8-amino-7-oxononanoate aminotransferase